MQTGVVCIREFNRHLVNIKIPLFRDTLEPVVGIRGSLGCVWRKCMPPRLQPDKASLPAADFTSIPLSIRRGLVC